MKLKTLCIALFLMTNHALAQDSWERYKPRTLNQIIQQHAPELVKVRGLEKVVSIISSDSFPSRVKAIYTGESRSVSAKKKELIFNWVKSPYFAQELKKGDEVTLLLIWVGVRRESEQTDWVFLVNDFETTDQQQGAPQKSASVASTPDAAIVRLIKEGIARVDIGSQIARGGCDCQPEKSCQIVQ